MQRLTLREAAERTSRSVTTLRRYIRSGRLHAEKRYGRFGPEYFVAENDLIEAGLDPDEVRDPRDAAQERLPARREETAPALRGNGEGVPLVLYQELQMKHEQLLVQYGMMRASGLQAMELRGELDRQRRTQQDAEARVRELERNLETERDDSRRRLSEAHLELQARALEIDALREKVRALEMLTRNAVTNETIERQFRDVMRQQARVRDLDGRGYDAVEGDPSSRDEVEPEH